MAQSLAHEGRSAGGVVMGLAVVLLVSGVIEAFVTPVAPADLGPGGRSGCSPSWRSWPTSSARIAGRVRAGWTGDIDAALLEDRPSPRLTYNNPRAFSSR